MTIYTMLCMSRAKNKSGLALLIREGRFTRQVARKVFSLSNSLALFVWHSAKKWISVDRVVSTGMRCFQSDQKLSIMKHCFYRKLLLQGKNSSKVHKLSSWINNIGFERLMHCFKGNSLTKHSCFSAKKPRLIFVYIAKSSASLH